MAWTAPRTWVTGEVVTAALGNTHWRDNLRYLKGLDGVPTIESGLTIDNTDGDERLLLPLLSTAECSTVLNAEGEVAHDEQTNRIKFYDGTGVRSLVSTADVDDTPANGATTDPVSSNWAYDFINTLTTQSDIPYATAAGAWTRLAKGTAGQYLVMNSGATAPTWTSAVVPTIVAKTADETVNNSNVLQNDDELLIAVGANTYWAIDIFLLLDCQTASDFKYTFTIPAAASFTEIIDSADYATENIFSLLFTDTITLLIDTAVIRYLLLRGLYIGGANAGNIQLQWAQSTAVVENTKVLKGSHLIGYQII